MHSFETAHHFSFEIASHVAMGSNSMAQKAHHVAAGKARYGVAHQPHG